MLQDREALETDAVMFMIPYDTAHSTHPHSTSIFVMLATERYRLKTGGNSLHKYSTVNLHVHIPMLTYYNDH